MHARGAPAKKPTQSSDPIDKITTFFVVYLIVSTMARRTKARFPQGEQLLPEEDESTAESGELRGAPA